MECPHNSQKKTCVCVVCKPENFNIVGTDLRSPQEEKKKKKLKKSK